MNSRGLMTLALLLPLFGSGCRTRLWEPAWLPGYEPYDPDRDRLDGGAPFDGPTITASCRQNRVSGRIDVLFVIDNSVSMSAMQTQLQNRFPTFIEALKDIVDSGTDIDMHLGVITTDYGAGPIAVPGCDPSPGGERGVMRDKGGAAPFDCLGPAGTPYISINSAILDGGTNLPPGQNLAQTFTCMASVGASGCGFEHVLEATRAALTSDIPRNRGFLRDDALLAVVFLTNEDDCSAPPDSDLFDPDKQLEYGEPLSYRCTRFGLMCGEPPAPPPYQKSDGELAMCMPSPSGTGKLYDLQRYLDLFAKPRELGGIKESPVDVILLGIDGPSSPVQIILATGSQADGAYERCSTLDERSNPPCTPTLDRSCRGASGFFGDPAIRLNTVIKAVPFHGLYSICDADYRAALEGLGELLLNHLGECCVPGRLPDSAGNPDTQNTLCVVEDVTWNDDGTRTATPLPRCSESQATPPCWRIEPRPRCLDHSPQGFAVVVERDGGQEAPLNTIARATCELAR